MIKKSVVLALICIHVIPFSILAKEKRGAELIVNMKDGQSVRGELITVKENSILLLSESGADVSVDVKDIKVITVVKKSKAALGFGIGFTVGAATLLIGAIAQDTIEGNYWEAFLVTLVVGIPTALIGAGIGAIIGTDKRIQIAGKSNSEIHESMEYLRKKARIPDYQ